MTPERDLWAAVLAAGLHDAAKGKGDAWIGTGDFHEVCGLAGLDPDAVADRFNPATYRLAA